MGGGLGGWGDEIPGDWGEWESTKLLQVGLFCMLRLFNITITVSEEVVGRRAERRRGDGGGEGMAGRYIHCLSVCLSVYLERLAQWWESTQLQRLFIIKMLLFFFLKKRGGGVRVCVCGGGGGGGRGDVGFSVTRLALQLY